MHSPISDKLRTRDKRKPHSIKSLGRISVIHDIRATRQAFFLVNRPGATQRPKITYPGDQHDRTLRKGFKGDEQCHLDQLRGYEAYWCEGPQCS